MYAQTRLWLLVNAIFCSAATAASAEELLNVGGNQLEHVKWAELAGWVDDDHLAAFAAYQSSCQAQLQRGRPDDRQQKPLTGALRNVCRKALALPPQDSNAARSFFEGNFHPVRIARAGEVEGLLTSYFEPIVQGSRFPNPEFHVPLYRRPPDLVAAGHSLRSEAFPNKNARIGRRNDEGGFLPYYDRDAIEAGALDGQKLEICWLKNSSDLLTIQIQGSARIILEDGTPLRVNYDSHNGYSLLSRAPHPDEAQQVSATNRSYMFFRITGLSNEGEPVGAQGVPLTPGRSIAVDRQHDYGTPFFIEANLPIESEKPVSPFRRLMIAQDTGSAIVGPARADIYWGSGDEAGRVARRIRHSGRFTILLPRELDLIAVAKHIPAPKPKPKFAEAEVSSNSGKGITSSTKSKTDPRAASPKPEPKIAEVKINNRNYNGNGSSTKSKIDPRAVERNSKPKFAEVEVRSHNGKGNASSTKSKSDPQVGAERPNSNHNGKGTSSSTRSKLSARAAAVKPKPKLAEVAVSTLNSKGNAGSTKSKIAVAPNPKPKFFEVQVSKHNGRSNARSNIDARAAAAYARWVRASSPR